jgi:hypothetical protein
MRLSGLSLAAVLLFSSAVLAQHSSGGGGGGGGGGHGGSSGGGGSSASSGGHSSGGSASHGSVSHGSSTHGSSAAGSASRSNSQAHSNTARAIRAPRSSPTRGRESFTKTQPEKRSFFSLLRHHFRRSHRPATEVRRSICLTGPCQTCPVGQARFGGACTTPRIVNNTGFCSHRDLWIGSSCLQQTRFLDDCSGLRMALERQAQRMQVAEQDRQSACTAGAQECADLTGKAQSETSFYRELQAKYAQCRQRSPSGDPSGNFAQTGARGLLLDPR